MNKLSIVSINAKAPYQVKFKPETVSYLLSSKIYHIPLLTATFHYFNL